MRTQLPRRGLFLWGLCLLLFTSGPATAQWMRPAKPKMRAVNVVAQAPADAYVAVGWALQGQADYDAILRDLRGNPQNSALAKVEAKLGATLPELFAFFQGTGFLAISPSEDPTRPTVRAAMKLAQEQALINFLQRHLRSPHPQAGGRKVWTLDKDLVLAVDHGYLLLSNTEEGSHTLDKSPKLATNPLYRKAVGSLPVVNSAVAIYADGPKVRDALQSIPNLGPMPPAEELAFWDYAFLSVDFLNHQTDGILAASEGDSYLAKALKQPGQLDQALLATLPKQSFLAGADLGWLHNALSRLSDDSPLLGMAIQVGFEAMNQYGDALTAFPGPVAVSSDFLDVIAHNVSEEGDEEPRVSLVAKVGDPQIADAIVGGIIAESTPTELDGCESNLQNLATAMEMWSVEHEGHYPKTVRALVPEYLRAIPICPAAKEDTYSTSLQTGPKAEGNDEKLADYYLLRCQGHHHPELQADYPTFDGTRGLTTGPVQKLPRAARAALPLSGSRTYDAGDDITLKLDGPAHLLRMEVGPTSTSRTAAPALLPVRVLEAARWGEDDLVALGYIDYAKLHQAGLASLRAHKDDPEATLFVAFLEQLEKLGGGLDEVHALKATPRGLLYRGQGISSTPILGATAIFGVGAFVPDFSTARQEAQLTACKANLKNIGVALELWAVEHDDVYPDSLSQLTPDYLRIDLKCPAAERDTYTESYRHTAPDPRAGTPAGFNVFCSGANHTALGLSPDSPAYSSDEELTEE